MTCFSVATFNVRGLNDNKKKEDLSIDIDRYKVDVACLQECKIKDGIDEEINGKRLYVFPTVESSYGLGFIINEKWIDNVYRVWKVNERIAAIQITPAIKREERKYKVSQKNCKTKIQLPNIKKSITIINVYAPHSQLTQDHPEQTEALYDKLDETYKNLQKKSDNIIIAGDFNGSVG